MPYRRSYRRNYGRSSYRRAPARVYATNGRRIGVVKTPSYKNLAYKGNEKTGILREVKFVKKVALDNNAMGDANNPPYKFMYMNLM